MADDGAFQRFLNTQGGSDGPIPLVNVSNPVQWGALATGIAVSFIATISSGIASVWLALRTAYSGLIVGVTNFFTNDVAGGAPDGLEDITDGGGAQGVEGLFPRFSASVLEGSAKLWQFDLEQFGIFAFPVAVASILLTLWVLQYAANYLREVGS